ncbi:S8 family serine peptidase [Flavobacterium sp. ARAG 55.4]|uniref:S8 family peptidase n=1 Tax=Flavobacterium sp. ARAG 55.4 TaxID=3451357 RepID=UPI003F467E78
MRKSRLLFLLLFPLFVFSQEEAWVYFNAKANEHYFYNNPLKMLSQRALDRRNTQNIALDFKDIPIDQNFISIIKKVSGIQIMAKSKWMNAIHVRGSQNAVNALKKYGFVSKIDFANPVLNQINKGSKIVIKKNKHLKKEKHIPTDNETADLQIKMLNGQVLHQQKYTGSGKILAVLDAGFLGVDKIVPFKRLRDNKQILGVYNFVTRSDAVYTKDSHGTNVLSTMGAYTENSLTGTAIGASYYLFVTEDVSAENPVEESLWVEAAEKADSLGVDIINSSLGYTEFDNPAYNHTYEQRNGSTAFISQGAEIAFSRGMLVVVSAGNEGATKDPYIGAPADAASVIGVGAVNEHKNRVSFSSAGPTSDGRIKPEVMALGQNTVVSDENGNNIYLNGSSFSAPLIAGMLACLWQAYPEKTNQEIKEMLLESSDNYNTPDNLYGYGIPDFNLALTNKVNLKNENLQYFVAYPNPASDVVSVRFPADFNKGKILFYNVLGQKVLESKVLDLETNFSLEPLSKGLYFYKIESDFISRYGKIIKN